MVILIYYSFTGVVCYIVCVFKAKAKMLGLLVARSIGCWTVGQKAPGFVHTSSCNITFVGCIQASEKKKLY